MDATPGDIIGSYVPNTFAAAVNKDGTLGTATQSTANGTPAMSVAAVLEAAAKEAEAGAANPSMDEEDAGDLDEEDEIEETARPVGRSFNQAMSAALRTRQRRTVDLGGLTGMSLSLGHDGGDADDEPERPPTQSMTSNVAETPADVPAVPPVAPSAGHPRASSAAPGTRRRRRGFIAATGLTPSGRAARGEGGRSDPAPRRAAFAPPPPRSPPAPATATAAEPPDSPDFCEMMSQQVRDVVSAAARAYDSQATYNNARGSNDPVDSQETEAPEEEEKAKTTKKKKKSPIRMAPIRLSISRTRGSSPRPRAWRRRCASCAKPSRRRVAEEEEEGEEEGEEEEEEEAEAGGEAEAAAEERERRRRGGRFRRVAPRDGGKGARGAPAAVGADRGEREAGGWSGIREEQKAARVFGDSRSPSQSEEDREEVQQAGVARTRAQRARRSDWKTRQFFGDSQFPPRSPGDDEEDVEEEEPEIAIVSDDDAPVVEEDEEDEEDADADGEDAWYVGGTQAFPDMSPLPEEEEDEEDADAPPPNDKPLTPLGCSKCRYASKGCGRCRTMRQCDMDGTPYPWSAAARREGAEGGRAPASAGRGRGRGRGRGAPSSASAKRSSAAIIRLAAGPVRGRRRGPRRRRPAQPPHAVVGEATQKVSEAFSVLGQETGPTARRRRRASRRRRSAELEEARQAQAALVHLRRPHLLPLRIRPRRVRALAELIVRNGGVVESQIPSPGDGQTLEPFTPSPPAGAPQPVAPDPADYTRVVTPTSMGRTLKCLYASAIGAPVVTPAWVREAAATGNPSLSPSRTPPGSIISRGGRPSRDKTSGQSRVIPRLRAHLRGTRVRAERGRRVSRAVRGAARARRRVRRGWVRVGG